MVLYCKNCRCLPFCLRLFQSVFIVLYDCKIHNVLQEIWDEVGENDEERDKMLLQLEQECLDVYKRKVEQAAKSRAQLLQALSDSKLELSSLLSALGEKSFVGIVSNF